MNKLLNEIKFWLKASRYLALPQSVISGVTAVVMGATAAQSSVLLGITALFGVAFAHLGINLFDDYFDYKSGSVEQRLKLANGGIRARLGKCHYLLDKSAEPRKLFIAAGVFCLIASAIGLFLASQRGVAVLVIAGVAAIMGYFYSAPPLKLSYRGLSEICVGIMFGPLLMSGVYYCVTGMFSLSVLLVSFAMGLLIFNILFAHSIMDYESDAAAGKKTLVILINNRYTSFIVSVLAITAAYLSIFVAIYLKQIPSLCAGVAVTIPVAWGFCRLMYNYVTQKEIDETPKFWMGKMENWERIKETGIGWFMIRWYLSRNLMVAFALVFCVTYFIGVKIHV